MVSVYAHGQTIYDLYPDREKLAMWWINTGSVEDGTRYVFIWYDQEGYIHVTHWSWTGNFYTEDDTYLYCATEIDWDEETIDLFSVNGLPLVGLIC